MNMQNWHKSILSVFLMGVCIIVVMKLGDDESHTTTEIKLASKKTATDSNSQLPGIKPSQVTFPEQRYLNETKRLAKADAAAKKKAFVHGKDPNNPGNGFGAGIEPETGGLAVPKKKPSNPCDLAEDVKGKPLLKAGFGSEDSDCSKFKAAQEKKKLTKEGSMVKSESSSAPASLDVSSNVAKKAVIKEDKGGMQNSLYYQWCTSRSRNGKIEVRSEASLCPVTKQQCTTTCGFPGNKLYGKIFCETIVGRKKVLSKFCDFPSPPSRVTVCKPTAPCVKYVTKTPSALSKTCPATCGSSARTLYGSVHCEETVSRKKVSDSKCAFWKHRKPSVPTQGCSSTDPCTGYQQENPPGCPAKSCGQAGNTEYGAVNCIRTQGGSTVPDSECARWGHTKPAAKARGCAGGPRCCGAAGKCAMDCCTFVARWVAPTNSCANCPFGNHHVYPATCGTSRQCDQTRL